MNNYIDTLFKEAIANREKIIFVFKALYVSLFFLLLIGGYSLLTNGFFAGIFDEIGSTMGDTALILYITSTIPGIARRFQLKNKAISLLMIYRRYIGILMFLAAFIHFFFVRGVWFIRLGFPQTPVPAELFGSFSLFLSFPLFATSNDFSVQLLKKWWNTIHKLTYIIMIFICLHVLLQGISIWSISITFTAVIQLISFIYSAAVLNKINPLSLKPANRHAE